MKGKCVWVLFNAVHCGKPTKYVMINDGGEPGAALVREYAVFCTEHKKKAERSDYED